MLNEKVHKELIKLFKAAYGKEPAVVAYAPGRIEVLGNHTDYNEGYVFSAAIDKGTFFACSKNDTKTCHLMAGDLKKEVVFPVDSIVPAKVDTWSNYVKGTFAGLAAVKTPMTGFDAVFLGNIPLGCGLSSSAALEMATALALAKLYGIELPPVELAKIGQKAEHRYAGCKCGLLDQISSLAGKKDSLVKTDFRTLVFENVPMGSDACFLMADPHARHQLVEGAYDKRRAACEEAAAYFARELRHPVKALRDVSMAEWAIYKGGLPEVTAARAAHPIGEDERVLLGAKHLAAGDLESFGRLMFDSHESSRVLFENSCPELDAVVEAAKKIPVILGARLSGGGFGGAAVVLVHARDAETAAQALASATGADVSVIHPSDGATIING